MVVSLLLLLVMTVLALTASQSTTLQERMAGNARDTALAFQSGEAGLREAEAVLAEEARANGRALPCDQTGTCPIKERNVNFKPDLARVDTFFTREYGGNGKQIGDVISDPLIYSEQRGLVPDTLSLGKANSPESGVAYYSHTVRAKGGTDTATVVLQTIDAVRYPR
jgi:type IV pilus assembly protein PilX